MLRKQLSLWVLVMFLLVVPGAAQAQGVDGASSYAIYCAGCHQPSGEGLAGVFPPLAGHAAEVVQVEGGRRYLVNAVLFGVQGAITVGGVSYDGVMPSWFQLSDDEIAAVLNHVLTAWDADALPSDVEPYAAAEVAAARRGALTAEGVWQRRPDLGEEADAEAEELPLASFTTAQVDRVRSVYANLCSECHGDDFNGGLIGGPPLRGQSFLQRWGGRGVDALFTFTRTQMPQGGPNSLPAQQYADLVALILSVNGHEAGEEELRGDPDVLRGLGVRSP